MQIASQHAKAISQRTRIRVKKRLLLNRIALHSADISPRHIQSAAAVVPHLANAGLSLRYRTAMPARITPYPIAIQLLVKLALANLLVNDIAKRSHQRNLYWIF